MENQYLDNFEKKLAADLESLIALYLGIFKAGDMLINDLVTKYKRYD